MNFQGKAMSKFVEKGKKIVVIYSSTDLIINNIYIIL